MVLLFCSIFVFGQNSPSRPEPKAEPSAGSPDEKPTNNGFDHVVGAHRRQAGAVEILSDTRGVDFGPYVQRMLSDVKYHWFKLVPESDEMKQGKLAIEFAISKEGRVANNEFGGHLWRCCPGSCGVERHHIVESISAIAYGFHRAFPRAAGSFLRVS
jgi:hypothetical protein